MSTASLSTIAALAVAVAPCLPQDRPPAPAELAMVDAFPSQKTFQRPVYLDHHPSDPEHRYVVEQTGRILRVPLDGDREEREVFLDFRRRVLHPESGGHNEEGLLGFAFDPDYAENRQVYVYYSQKVGEDERSRPRRQSVISRLRVVEDGGEPVVDAGSELVLLEVPQPWGNHNGGTIVFGPDRMLYVALGDGGAANDRGGNGQNLGTLLAAILRLDVASATAERPYRVPQDNPFVDRQGARGEIWAYGLRNPWRISFDRATGELWCGDVGQNLWEEVDRIVRGGNYGWPLREATHAFPPGRDTEGDPEDLIPPVTEYPRKDGISVTGGYVYRGKRIPALAGRFVYGDFATRTIWAVREAAEGEAAEVVRIGQAPGPLASFAEEPDGELLALCFDGRIYRLTPK